MLTDKEGHYPDLAYWDSACDYYRATMAPAQMGGYVGIDDCREWVAQTATALALDSGDMRGVSMLGYDGWQHNGVYMGRGPQGIMWQVSGAAAVHGWRAIPASARPTRIDLQLTACMIGPDPDLGLHEYYVSEGRAGGRAKSAKRTIIMDNRGGCTLYLGSRQSERFGRLYDRGIATKTDERGRLWRWECELKEGAALAMAPIRENVMATAIDCARVVGEMWRRWGIWFPPHIPPGLWIPSPTPPAQYDLTKRLRWLATQVSSTVVHIEHVSNNAGLALGILGLIPPPE